MKRCPTIIGIKFDKDSVRGIKRLKRTNQLTDVLVKFVAVGTFANIFLGNKVPEITFNLYNSDWHLFHQALTGLPTIAKKVIDTEARMQYIDHMNDPKQRQFWEAIIDGCALD